MKKNLFSRMVSLVLALAVFVMFPMTFTQEAQAASTKTFYVTTSATYTYKYQNEKSSTYYEGKHKRDKNGFLIKDTFDDGYDVYTHNSKGDVTKIKHYEGKELSYTDSFVYTYGSNGRPKTEKWYFQSPGEKKELQNTTKYTYYSNKHVKKKVCKSSDGTDTYLYRKDGTLKSSTNKGKDSSSAKNTYDSHGNVKTSKSISEDYSVSENHTTLEYDTHGNLIKDVYTLTDKFNNKTSTTKVTVTIEYKYDKHGNILKCVTTKKSKEKGKTIKETNTYKYTYKTVKVTKKYWHFYE